MEYFDLKICGLSRKLPLIRVGKNTRIASFSILGDVELTDCLADEIAKRLKKIKFDYLVGPEVKVLPLIHGVAKRLGHKRFVICRKSIKPYMISPVKLEPLSHFPKHIKPLVLNGSDSKLLKNKKIVVIDDVISTGVTMRMIAYLMKKLDAKVITYFAALKQGEQFDEIKNLTYLGELPIFRS
ncbi:MAG: adenine phosphoribosyltransferase [Candidatus Woesebacteria bacterium]|nr:MAG: adenine phosphoribosyltransferase [Candidatus Woesebacteria bacterium]